MEYYNQKLRIRNFILSNLSHNIINEGHNEAFFLILLDFLLHECIAEKLAQSKRNFQLISIF